jgi:prolyl oligopeptidase PreP (S9A serine peptidase family)
LLFYERIDQDFKEEIVTEDETKNKEKSEAEAAQEIEELIDEDELAATKKSKNIFDHDHPIQLKIAFENRNYWQNKFLFAQEYFDFVADLSYSWDTSENTPLNSLKKNDDEQITGHKFRVKGDQPRRLSSRDVPLPSDVSLDLLENNKLEEIQDA